MPNPSVGPDAYQDLDAIRERIEYEGTDLFQDNEQLRFDELLVRLEKESRGIFETLWGDQTPLEELERVDTIRTTDDAAISLVYPIQQIRTVEYKVNLGADWETLDADQYDSTAHNLVLRRGRGMGTLNHAYRHRANPLKNTSTRMTWAELAAKLRVTYDRGFSGGAPADVKSVQIQLINAMLRKLRGEQTIDAASPDELGQRIDTTEVVTDEIRSRISDVTKPGRGTMTI